MKKFTFFLLGMVLGIAIIYGVAAFMQNKSETEEKGVDNVKMENAKYEKSLETSTPVNENITVTKPLANALISTPVSIEGSAKGTWFFEAVSPVKVIDEQRKEIGSGTVKAVGNWMTEDFVPFKGQISFDKTSSKTGFLIFENSNPSGLKDNAQEFKLPVKFQ